MTETRAAGFSLIELLVATAITVGVGSIVFQLFHQNERMFRDEAVRIEMQQTARMVLSQIADDIRIAGQSVPPGLSDVILAGSTGHRLNMRAGISAIESIVTTPLPITVAAGNSITLKVESTIGFSAARQIFLWNAVGWVRATVDSVSGSAKTVRMTPSTGGASSVSFDSPPVIGLDEATTVYLDTATNTVRRATASNTSNATSPAWGPSNELATNVVGLDFLYFDSAGQLLMPDTPQNQASVSVIEARVQVRSAVVLADKTRPVFTLSVTAQPRNLRYR